MTPSQFGVRSTYALDFAEHEEVTLTPNTLLPSHAPTTALP